MSSAEEQEILARIGQLAGQINRHKNQQAGVATSPAHHYHPYHSPTNAYSSWGRGAGGYHARGGRGAKVAPHRHRSLVLNNTANHNGAVQPGGSTKHDPDSGANSDASTSSWVTKKDRHLQLINPAVYEKEAQARTKAMAESTRQKERAVDDRERSKLLAHLGGGVTPATPVGYANTRPNAQYEVVVDGIRFNVAKNGSKLVKIIDNNAPKATPKMAVVGGVKFYRSRNGNLYRHGIVKAQRYGSRSHVAGTLTENLSRRSGTVRKVDTPCRMFSMTGSCTNGPRCRYIHDPAKVAICRDFLVTGDCVSGGSCDLSHELTDERTPACVHYAKGKCTNPDCRYAHMQVTPGAPVCRDFGMLGYCSKGANCDERHVFECPDFSNTGVCKTKGCKLPHRERASVLRKAGATAGDNDVDMADISSDEDGESVDSNDVDSDAVDEFLGDDASEQVFDPNQEYIQL
ncbi:hypothetical protein RB600_007141 [Gaeumannomyces tritici]